MPSAPAAEEPDDRRTDPPAAPSRTGQGVAGWRARLDRPCSPDGDPGAQSALCAGLRPPGTDTEHARTLYAHVAARTRFIDDQVLRAVGGAFDQVVVLGAGYDDRALRFRAPGLRFFELDLPTTQSDKRRRLEAMGVDPDDPGGPTLAPVDFRHDDVAAALEAVGHRADRSSLFVCEGLFVYLDEEAVVGLLVRLRARAGPGSALVATLAVHSDGLDPEVVRERANAARPDAGAEPWRTILPPARHRGLLERAGWSVGSSVDDADIGTGAVPGRSLLVLARPAGPPGPTGDRATLVRNPLFATEE